MDVVADLHLHSRFSRAVSPAMTLSEMAKWAALKGLHLLSAADFTHPLWIREIKSQLREHAEGMYRLKNTANSGITFLLSTEISCIYKQGEKLRRIHNLVFVPGFTTAESLNTELLKRGCNLSADGRPIIGISSKDLLELCLTIDRRCIMIPAHVWTPHFGIYGSASGFNSLSEAFGDLSKYIYGIETGLSSDPLMNWQIAELRNRSILSFSDAHSLPKMGREATVFSFKKKFDDVTYMDFGRVVSSKMKRVHDSDKQDCISYTIEFYPEEGKYHYTGHRNCHVSKTPENIKKEGNICPVCKRRLTEGVMYRVEEIGGTSANFSVQLSHKDKHSVQWIDDPSKTHPSFVKLVPLYEIIAESLRLAPTSEKVKQKFFDMVSTFSSEIALLLTADLREVELKFGEKIADGIRLVREGNIVVEPGYDGEYGKVTIWQEEQEKQKKPIHGNGTTDQLGLDF